MKRSLFALALTLSLPAAVLAANTPFERLSGQWAGKGTVELIDGNKEPLRCKAAYDVLSEGRNLQLSIRCASQSYNFELRSSANYDAGKIDGSWSEATMNIAGQISGKAEGNRIQVLANSAVFTATLTLVTNGDRQSVTIHSQQSDSKIKGATMTLSRA